MKFVMLNTEDKVKTHFFIVFSKVIIKTKHVLKSNKPNAFKLMAVVTTVTSL